MKKIAKASELWERVEAGRLKETDVPALVRSDAGWEHIWNALGHASVSKILRYIEKNVEEETERRKREKEEARLHNHAYWSRRPTAIPDTYRDYLNECVLLHLDLDDRQVLFPKNLQAAHERTMAQVKYQASEIKREQFAKACDKIRHMEWEADGLLIRLPKDPEELISEGAYLHHCVAGYADRMADGKTTILLIRRAEAPDVPFYTLEWLNGRVQQCRTLRNASYQDDEPVFRFVEEWIKKVVNKRKKKAAQTAA